jgi:hypothetical protein
MLGKVCHQFICPVAAGQCPITDLHQDIDHSERCVLDHAGEKIPRISSISFPMRTWLGGASIWTMSK